MFTATEARKITDAVTQKQIANANKLLQKEINKVEKKINKAAKKGLNFCNFKILSYDIQRELKNAGFEVIYLESTGYYVVRW